MPQIIPVTVSPHPRKSHHDAVGHSHPSRPRDAAEDGEDGRGVGLGATEEPRGAHLGLARLKARDRRHADAEQSEERVGGGPNRPRPDSPQEPRQDGRAADGD